MDVKQILPEISSTQNKKMGGGQVACFIILYRLNFSHTPCFWEVNWLDSNNRAGPLRHLSIPHSDTR